MPNRMLSSRGSWFLVLLVLLLPLTAAARLPAAVDGQVLPSLAPMLERTTPAVVNIATRGRVVERSPLLDDPVFRRFFNIPDQPRERQTQGLGSGVIVDAAKGHVLTNHHVIDKADEIVVTLNDGRSLPARVVGTDAATDLAVLAIEPKNLQAVRLADSGELRVGDFIVAIGNPFGLGQTVTSGIVSALGRSGLGIEAYEDFIQTDASINPGNSGGALVNLRGELVGINTAIFAPNGGNIGIGFAIPVNMAREVMTQLVEYGEIRRGRLGISVQDLTPELAEAFGITDTGGSVVAGIDPGSPAEKAGLKEGDVITAINGRPVRSSSDLRNVVGLMRVGSKLRMEIRRQNRRMEVVAIVAEVSVKTIDGGSLHSRLTGAVFSDIGEDSLPRERVNGILVKEIDPATPAAYTGLRPGDIILSVNRKPATSVEELVRLASGASQLQLNIQRGRRALFIMVQ